MALDDFLYFLHLLVDFEHVHLLLFSSQLLQNVLVVLLCFDHVTLRISKLQKLDDLLHLFDVNSLLHFVVLFVAHLFTCKVS